MFNGQLIIKALYFFTIIVLSSVIHLITRKCLEGTVITHSYQLLGQFYFINQYYNLVLKIQIQFRFVSNDGTIKQGCQMNSVI